MTVVQEEKFKKGKIVGWTFWKIKFPANQEYL